MKKIIVFFMFACTSFTLVGMEKRPHKKIEPPAQQLMDPDADYIRREGLPRRYVSDDCPLECIILVTCCIVGFKVLFEKLSEQHRSNV